MKFVKIINEKWKLLAWFVHIRIMQTLNIIDNPTKISEMNLILTNIYECVAFYAWKLCEIC